MAKRNPKNGRFSGMKENPKKSTGEGLRLYYKKLREDRAAAGIRKKPVYAQFNPLKRYGRKNTNKMHNALKVRPNETHEQWMRRTSKHRLKLEEDFNRTNKGKKVYKIYATAQRKEYAERVKEVIDARFNARPKLFLQYLWALFGYFEVKYGLDRDHFQFVLYLDSLERPFSKDEFMSKCEAFGIKHNSFKAWVDNHIIIDIAHNHEATKNSGMFRLYHDISQICYWFYEYLSGDKMVPQLKLDHQKKTSVNTMLLDLHEEMTFFLEGVKPQVLTLRFDEYGNRLP